MNEVKVADKQSSNNPRKHFHELEDKIFEQFNLDYRFKEILHPFAVLEKNRNHVLLGSTKGIVGKIEHNFTIRRALEERVGSVVGDKYIKVEIKTAENEFQTVKKRIEKKKAGKKKEEQVLAEIEEQKNEGK